MNRRAASRRPTIADIHALARELEVQAGVRRGAAPDEQTLAARRTAAAKLELARALHHLRRTRSGRLVLDIPSTQVKGTTMQYTDTPPELSEQSDGLSDDGAFDASIIGCGPACAAPANAVSGVDQFLVGSGLPSYLFTRRGLSNSLVRRRAAAAIKALSPKMRRRVMARLHAVAQQNRVSGAIRGVTPSIAGYAGGNPAVGWTGVTIGRCPYASVAGPLTP